MLLLALLLQAPADSGGVLRAALATVPAAERAALDSAYQRAGWQLLWHKDGRSTATATLGREALRAARERGLDPSDYPSADAVADTSETAIAHADVALSRDLLRFARHLVRGRVDPRSMDPEFEITGRTFDAVQTLAALRAAPAPAAYLDSLEITDPEYWWLRRALMPLRAVADTATAWSADDLPRVLRANDSGAAVLRVRQRLRQLGDLSSGIPDVEVFDSTLVDAVMRFQARHGLPADGVIGPATREALGQSLAWRVRQVELSLERWRWFADPNGGMVIDVDVPAATVRLREGLTWSTVLAVRAAVGTVDDPTPVMESVVHRVVINPTWVVPNRIARDEYIPKFQKDSTAFAKGRFELRQGGVVVPPTPENIAAMGRTVTLRQLPGPANALGRIKLDVASALAIHLHDTPTRTIFARDSRLLSHGCVRVEHPANLAEALLGKAWPRERIQRAIRDSVTVVASLTRPVPVRMMYATAVADSTGTVTYRPDVYRRDPALDDALRRRTPLAAN